MVLFKKYFYPARLPSMLNLTMFFKIFFIVFIHFSVFILLYLFPPAYEWEGAILCEGQTTTCRSQVSPTK